MRYPKRWDKEADVVVIGYGGAGAVAAITACEMGGKVILLEKAPEPGGNTATASGGMRVPGDGARAAQYIEAVSLGSVDRDTARAFAAHWMEMEAWFQRHGAKLVFLERGARWKLPGFETFQRTAFGESAEYKMWSGKILFEFLDRIVQGLGGEVLLNAPARRLVQDAETKEIVGVLASSNGKDVAVRARRAVIMTCGGFEANREMLATYIEPAPVPIYVSGTPHNTGDGIKMVMEVGADLWHMNGLEWARPGLKVPEFPAAFWLSPRGWSWINVNRYGRRFRDESYDYGHTKKTIEVLHFDNEKTEWPNHPWYMVFDEKTRKAGSIILREKEPGRAPFSTYNISSGLYMPSADNKKEIDKGWIEAAETIGELAKKTGIDQHGLEETINKYNSYCKNGEGVDPDFRRDPLTLKALDTPPYYSVECALNVINTQGGPRRNAACQVLNPYGEPIPRLYAGGEFGSLWGYLYPGSCNLPECVVSGIIAGQHAAVELPR